MVHSTPSSAREQIVDTMVDLTRLSNLHRVIVAGSDSLEVYLSLHRRGFVRVVTKALCHVPCGQHTVGLIAGQHSLQALNATLAEISHFLGSTASIAVAIDSRESGVSLKVRERLEKLGFRIEAGVRCQQGLVLSAYRRNFGHMANAA
jgi:hypothetical protein